jgi:hypothetical protein
MKHRYHSGSPIDAASKEAAKVKPLIDELNRRIRILESDIAREEDVVGVSNPSNTAYPVLARMMTAQRDNLKQTIAVLERRLPPEPAQVA